MNFDIKDLPFAQFEQLGMSKKDVLSMKPEDLSSMLSGGRSEMQPLNIKELGGIKNFTVDAKLSLVLNPDNSVSLQVHPYRPEIKNDLGISPDKLDQLKQGKALVLDIKAQNGELTPHLVQLDRQTNELLRTRIKDIVIPDRVAANPITPDQKEQLKQGQAVEIQAKSSDTVATVKLDLLDRKGYSVDAVQVNRSLERDQQKSVTLKAEVQDIKQSPNLATAIKPEAGKESAYIVHFNPKGEPAKADRYVAANHEDVYLRVAAVAKQNDVRVEKVDGLTAGQVKEMTFNAGAFAGRGQTVLTSVDGGKNMDIKEPGLKSAFEKLDGLAGKQAVKETPVIAINHTRKM